MCPCLYTVFTLGFCWTRVIRLPIYYKFITAVWVFFLFMSWNLLIWYFFPFCVCVHAHVCAGCMSCVCTSIWSWKTNNATIVRSTVHLLCLSLAWSLPIKARLLASGLQGSCLFFPSVGIISTHHEVQDFRMGSEEYKLILQDEHLTDWSPPI